MVYGIAVLAGMPFAWPYDFPVNLGGAPSRPDLRPPADGKRRVVVLVHGILRSSHAFGRMTRTLRDHGYEVLAFDYPSTSAPIEAHAARLTAAITRLAAAGSRPVDEWSFVGHSMGGLVIQEHLRTLGRDAAPPHACIYIATPQRGAMLADLRKHWFLFRWVMGTEAATQLSPGDAFHGRPAPHLDRSAVIAGDIERDHQAIPGPDDGTVGVEEASLPGVPRLLLPFGHTAITARAETVEQVLTWLRYGRFETPAERLLRVGRDG